MNRRSLADAKAHFSALVDQAEHKKTTTLILRHGKPAAALVPVEQILDQRPPTIRRPSPKRVDALFESFAKAGPEDSAVKDLLKSRR